MITCIVFPRFVWYFRLWRSELEINDSAKYVMLPISSLHSFLLKRHNKHSRPSNQCYPCHRCLHNTTSRHNHSDTHRIRAANTLSEPCTACRPYLWCSLTFNKLGILVFRPFTSTRYYRIIMNQAAMLNLNNQSDHAANFIK